MAGITTEITYNLEGIKKLQKQLPSVNAMYLRIIGKDASTMLKKNYLSGQELDLRTYPRDSQGRNTVAYELNKKMTAVRIYSYPVNLFETGRKLRNGRHEAGKYIITKKLKDDVDSKMTAYVAKYERILYARAKDLIKDANS